MEIKGYRIEKVIGRGGMASVYLAVQTTLDRHVALKIMNPAFSNDQEFTSRFLQEGPIAAKLNDPQIVTVYDSGVDEKHYYLAMEYLPGGTLKQKIRTGISPEKSLNIIKLLAKGLSYAHSQGVLHRDVKPQNIMFRASGEPVLTDFGIAKILTGAANLTVPGTAFGSPKYMSPEQAKGAPLDNRSDLYSLGVVFYEMFCSHPPFESKDAVSLAQKHITETPPPLPEQFAHFQPLFDRLLAKDPADRFQTSEHFLAELKEVRARYFLEVNSGAHPILDTTKIKIEAQPEPDPSGSRKISAVAQNSTQPKKRGNAKLLATAAVLVLAIAGGGYIYYDYANRQQTPKPVVSNQDEIQQILARANQLQQQGNTAESLSVVREALQSYPDNAQLLVLQSDLISAQQVASQLTETTPNNPSNTQTDAQLSDAERIDSVLVEVRHLRQQGKLEQGLALIDDTLREFPQQAELLATQKELQDVIDDLDKRTQAASFLALAQRALEQDQLTESRRALYQGLAIVPDHLELLALQEQIEVRATILEQQNQLDQYYRQAEVAFAESDFSTALTSLDSAIAINAEDQRIATLREQVLAAQQAVQEEQERARQLQQQIAQMLDQADAQLASLQLTTPEGNNAFASYSAVLAQQSDNEKALAGLQAIADKYHELALRAHSSNDIDKALDFIERGLNVRENHQALSELQEQINQQQIINRQIQLAQQYLNNNQLEDGLQAVEDGLEIAPDNTDLATLRDSFLQRLNILEQQLIAQKALAEAKQLERDNQYQQAIQVLDSALQEAPDAPQASQLQSVAAQLQQALRDLEQQAIATESLVIAEQYLSRNELANAYAEVRKGLEANPADSALLALKQQIEKQQRLIAITAKAQELFAAEELENSQKLVKQGLEIDPSSADLLALSEQIEVQLTANDSTTDAVILSEGIATIAEQIGLANVEDFFRERTDQLEQPNGTINDSIDATNNTATTPAATTDTVADGAIDDTTGDDTTGVTQDDTQLAMVNDDIATTENTDTPEVTTSSIQTTEPAPAVDSTEQQITALLQQARRHMSSLNLTTPEGNNAYETYQKVLQLDSDNQQAQRGLDNIVERYRGWAITQRDRGRFNRSLGHIEKALKVSPRNKSILTLRDDVLAKREAARSPRSTPRRNNTTPSRPSSRPSRIPDPCKVDRQSKECWCAALDMFCN